jgi:hypothetical protein
LATRRTCRKSRPPPGRNTLELSAPITENGSGAKVIFWGVLRRRSRLKLIFSTIRRGTEVALPSTTEGDEGMLETIAIILIILWLLGMVSGYTLGNFIWVLLVIAVVLFLVRLVSGRRVV